ncbi:MAG: hypothetical protein AAF518_11500 [Spirochaetota bacterium]
MKTLRCTTCSSTELVEEKRNHYRCLHCGSKFYWAPDDPSDAKEQAHQTINKKFYFGIFALLLLFLFSRIICSNGGRDRSVEKPKPVAKKKMDKKKQNSQLVRELPNSEKSFANISIKLEFVGAHSFYQKTYKRLEVNGFIANTGKVAVEKPKVDVLLLNSSGNIVQKRTVYSRKKFLLPGKKTPVATNFYKAKPNSRFQFLLYPEPYLGNPFLPKIEFVEKRIEKRNYSGYKIHGKFKNLESFVLHRLNLIIWLENEEGHLLKIANKYFRNVPPNDETEFSYTFGTIKRKPTKVFFDYSYSN